MALTSAFLSDLLFERLHAFGLVGDSHEAGDAVVLDSNGSYLQHRVARQNCHCFKAMLPLTVVEVSGAPSALSCNGLYTKVGERLYVQNVDVKKNEYAPQARIIEFDGTQWHFKHRLAQGVKFSLLFEQQQNHDLVGHRDWQAFCGTDDSNARVYKSFRVCIKKLDEPEEFKFGFGMHGHTEHLQRDVPKRVLLSQKLHTDGQVDFDPHEFDILGQIVLETNPISTPDELAASSSRAQEQRLSGTSYLPSSTALPYSVVDGPLGALFCLMFGTCLGFIDLTMDIPIGACLLFSFVFPHKGAMYDYINRRLHLYILNKMLSRIPAGNVEQRLRVLACAQQRLESRGPTDYFDITLLENLSTHEIFVDVPDAIRPFCEDPINIVYGDECMYAGDINLNGQPNGFGCKVHSSNFTERGYFKNGAYISASQETDDCIRAARHVNTLRQSLQSLTRSCTVEQIEVCSRAAQALQDGLYNHVDVVEFQDILRLLKGVKFAHSARTNHELVKSFEFCIRAKTVQDDGANLGSEDVNDDTVSNSCSLSDSIENSSSPACNWDEGQAVLYVTATSNEHTQRGVVQKFSRQGNGIAYDIVLSSGLEVKTVPHSDVFGLFEKSSSVWPPQCFAQGALVSGKDGVLHGSSHSDSQKLANRTGVIVDVAFDINSQPAYYALYMTDEPSSPSEYWFKASDLDFNYTTSQYPAASTTAKSAVSTAVSPALSSSLSSSASDSHTVAASDALLLQFESNGTNTDRTPLGLKNSTPLHFYCCYNCILQILFHIGGFREAVYTSSSDNPVVTYLRNIFYNLDTSDGLFDSQFVEVNPRNWFHHSES